MEENQVKQVNQVEQVDPRIIVVVTPRSAYEKSIYFSSTAKQGFSGYAKDFSKSLSCLAKILLQQQDDILPLIGSELLARPQLKANQVFAKLAPIFASAVFQLDIVHLSIGDVHPETMQAVTEDSDYIKVIRCKLRNLPKVWIERALTYVENLPLTNVATPTTAAEIADPFA